MFDECVIRNTRFAPARFCAPLAGYTHSAFRRLLTEFGGCGAVWTEMLAAKQILRESFAASPYLRRGAAESRLVFQLMVREGDPLDRILGRLGEHGVEAVDLNLACDAMTIRAQQAGSALFENLSALRAVVGQARRHWPGLLTAKIRLGSRRADWQASFGERLRLLEENGVDAVTLHPRFFEDKFRRCARHELLPWAASLTRLPLIANGDFTGPDSVRAQAEHLRPACAVMIGRMAIARPWLFSAWDGPVNVDHAVVWQRMFDNIVEDFPPAVALRRVQMFTKYFAANFAFGHQFYVAVSNAPSLGEAQRQAEDFFSRSPATLAQPTVAGL
ncbi:MAG: tRNA-dihydrouridine synthase family protein [Verrucomicrobia bacterium]|nr:tRNA-dihydrouridine synthase family protein [Verrucomicrobiota bacterium]